MSTRRLPSLLSPAILTGLGLVLFFDTPAWAQFTDSNQTVIIDGVVSNWAGNYEVGYNMAEDHLQIINGAVLSSGGGYVGGGGLNFGVVNSGGALVSGYGSAWNNEGSLFVGCTTYNNIGYGEPGGNVGSLVITNGGAVSSYGGVIGLGWAGVGSVEVTGGGSVWNNQGGLTIGDGYMGNVGTGGNSLLINNGGVVVSSGALIGGLSAFGGNLVDVSGSGSVWNNQGYLTVGSGGPNYGNPNLFGGNSLVVSNGGVAVSYGASIGNPDSCLNSVLVGGYGSVWSNRGSLCVGNDGPPSTPPYGQSNGGNSLVINNGGTVVSSNVLVYGNNHVDLDGGHLIVTDGLMISSNAVLQGDGTITGTVTVNGGGMLGPGHSPGTMTINGDLILETNSILQLQIAGYKPGTESDYLSVTGNVSFAGILDVTFIDGFEGTITNGATFTLLTANNTGVVLSDYQDDGTNKTFLVSYDSAAGSFDNVASGERLLIPEADTWALCALGLVGLFGMRRRDRRT